KAPGVPPGDERRDHATEERPTEADEDRLADAHRIRTRQGKPPQPANDDPGKGQRYEESDEPHPTTRVARPTHVKRLLPPGYGLGIARGAARAMLSLVGMPLALLRGPEPSAADRVLRNVRAESASEALEVATYTAIERLAEAADDEQTARLAREIRADEERM